LFKNSNLVLGEKEVLTNLYRSLEGVRELDRQRETEKQRERKTNDTCRELCQLRYGNSVNQVS